MSARRRFFWGQSLAQAVARAARHHGVPADELVYRVHEKRHGFVKHPRRVLIEVDVAAPRRGAAPAPAPVPVAAAVAAPAAPEAAAPRARAREAAPPAAPAPRAAGEEAWEAPDEEAALAAGEAMRQLLAFARVDVDVTVRRTAERLEIELDGADRERLRGLGGEFLDALELLLPRAVLVLCGRRVRCRIEGAGLRGAREAELQELARQAAARVRTSGQPETLPELGPAERRVVHLALAEDPTVVTASVGQGTHKRLRISPTAAPPPGGPAAQIP